MTVELNKVVEHIRALVGASRESPARDSQLLSRFLASRDESSFAKLVTRHGPMVMNVCNRVLHNHHDAEDAFQATFMILARRGGGIRQSSVASWLHTVAYRSALAARSCAAERRQVEIQVEQMPEPEVFAAEVIDWKPVLDSALCQLADKHRGPIVLCDLEGLSRKEAALQLNIPEGTLSSRLNRARSVLGRILRKQGVALAGGVIASAWAESSRAALSRELVARTCEASLLVASGQMAACLTPGTRIMQGVLRAMLMEKLKTAVVAIGLLAFLCTAGIVLGLRAETEHDALAPKTAPPAAQSPSLPDVVQIGSPLFRFRSAGVSPRSFLTDGGATLVVLGEGILIQWLDVETGKKLHEITILGNLDDAALATDAEILAVSGSHEMEKNNTENALWLIDLPARKLVRTVPGLTSGRVNRQTVRISADGKRVFVEREGDVRIIDGKTGDELMRHIANINAGSLAASRDGKLVAFGRYDVFLWRWETGEEPKKFTRISGSGAWTMEFSPDGGALHIVPHGDLITNWDVATGRLIGSRPVRSLPSDLAFSPDGKILAVTYQPTTSGPTKLAPEIDLLNATSWNEVGRIPFGAAWMSRVSWSKDGARLTSASAHRAWVWDAKSAKVLGPSSPGHEGLIAALSFGTDGTLYTASDDHTIRSWNPITGAPGLELHHDYWVRDQAISPNGMLVAGSSLRNDLRVWEAKTGKLRFKLLGNGMMGGKRRVRFTSDGSLLLAWGDDDFVRVWDVRNGKLRAEYSTSVPGTADDPDDPFGDRERMMRAATSAIEFNPDGTALAMAADKGLRILDPLTGKDRQILNIGDNVPHAVAFSPDAKRIAVAYRGKQVQTKLPDGRTRHSTENEYPITVWDLASGKSLWTGKAEGSAPFLGFSQDGSRLAVGSSVYQGPSRLWFWNAANGMEIGRIDLPCRGWQLAFDRTGQRLAVALDDATAVVYNLETAIKPGK